MATLEASVMRSQASGQSMSASLVPGLPLMVWPHVLSDPMSSFSTAVSLFPPATPMLMILRLTATTAIPLWEPLLGIVLVIATTLLAVVIAGRIFRIGILAQGKTPKVAELVRWAIRG